MKILALDLATKTGWAFLDEGRIYSGVQDFSLKRGESIGMKWLYFRRWLSYFMEDRLFHASEVVVAYEQAHHRGGAATHHAHAFITELEVECSEFVCETTNRSTQDIKAHATGNRRASKEDMVKAAIKKWPEQNVEDDNQADALWLLDLVRTELGA